MRKTIIETKITRADERKFLTTSAKGGETQRTVKTAKLPTSLDELRKLLPDGVAQPGRAPGS